MVQSALNHQPADRLGGVPPITTFLALPASTPLHALFHPRLKEQATVGWLAKSQQGHLRAVASALERMHKNCVESAVTKRENKRKQREKKQGVKCPSLALGYFVLAARVVKHPNKLSLHWKGPYRVVQVKSDHLMEVQQLVPPHDVSLHHASRLKLYSEAERDVAEDLVEQVAFGDSGFHVEALEDIRDNAGRFEVKVKWLGLDEAEASWEPTAALYEDIPVIFRRWTKSNPKLKFMSTMLADVEKEDTVLTNVSLKMLPPNTTAYLQPQDAGIIASFKAKVKQRQLQNALEQINCVMAGRQDKLYEVPLVEAMAWAKDAWHDVTTTTIVNCWSRTGILHSDARSEQSSEPVTAA
ncbi:hypothetical protein H310_13046 [Aphanomyces invadans]|uniref:Chromo domain-containing protein n=1 Tax=Aphanomyces invadans TaxID=157072 RepID=A0A024TFD0_9STRA|nr:hypothetical protein H310_13046 [Aphanomyces invadans]ETV92855.1 hypothetical protein H310_13046 [Aphanomyces invadans]|eukprot:XP_008878625.1 hypothetical protein H310_13046 [Aphanomyces invadans]